MSGMRQGFPAFVNGMLQGGEKLDEVLQNGLRRYARGVPRRNRGLGRISLWTAAMSSEEQGEHRGTAESAESYFIPAGSGSRHVIFPGVEIRTTAGANLMLSVVRLEPESVVLDHSHPHEQMGSLLEGRLEFTVGGITRLAWSR